MEPTNSLSSLGITLEQLYECEKQIEVHISDKNYIFHVVLLSNDKPDCKISSYGANLWFRTKYGKLGMKYHSFSSLQRSIVTMMRKYVDANGDLTFKLSDIIYTI